MLLLLLASLIASAVELTPEALESRVAALAPVVEAVAGRPFATLPPVVVADPETLAAVVYAEQVHLLRQGRRLEAAQIEAQATRTAGAMEHAAFGKYGFLDDTLYVDIDGITAAVQGTSPALTAGVVDLVLAHELVHALQDQHLDLSRVAGGRAGDEGIAVVCALEGHAAWVQTAVARELDLAGPAALVAAFLGYDASSPGISSSLDAYHDSYVYGQGAAFVGTLQAAGGSEAVWDMLAAPPQRTTMLVHPERYGDRPTQPPVRLRRAATRARDALAEAGWTTGSQSVGDHAIRQTLLAAGGPTALASQLRTGWSTRAYHSARIGLDLQLLEFEDTESAAAFVDALRRGAQATVEATAGAPGVRGRLEELEVASADAAHLERFGLALPGMPPESVATATALRGSLVAQVILVNVELGSDALASGLARVLSRAR